jgi:hypothetical protein
MPPLLPATFDLSNDIDCLFSILLRECTSEVPAFGRSDVGGCYVAPAPTAKLAGPWFPPTLWFRVVAMMDGGWLEFYFRNYKKNWIL